MKEYILRQLEKSQIIRFYKWKEFSDRSNNSVSSRSSQPSLRTIPEIVNEEKYWLQDKNIDLNDWNIPKYLTKIHIIEIYCNKKGLDFI